MLRVDHVMLPWRTWFLTVTLGLHYTFVTVLDTQIACERIYLTLKSLENGFIGVPSTWVWCSLPCRSLYSTPSSLTKPRVSVYVAVPWVPILAIIRSDYTESSIYKSETLHNACWRGRLFDLYHFCLLAPHPVAFCCGSLCDRVFCTLSSVTVWHFRVLR
jgi:hypothetical protein